MADWPQNSYLNRQRNFSQNGHSLRGFSAYWRIQQDSTIEKTATSWDDDKTWGVEIVPYQQTSLMGHAKFKFESISQAASSLSRTRISSSGLATHNLLWHSACFLPFSEQSRSNWLGFLQCSASAVASQKLASTITFLPIIDLSPSDESCIYSTLLFIISQAEKLRVQTHALLSTSLFA